MIRVEIKEKKNNLQHFNAFFKQDLVDKVTIHEFIGFHHFIILVYNIHTLSKRK